MNILYLHQYFVPPGGSGGTRSLEFAKRLTSLGHRVTLITSDAFFPEEQRALAAVERRSLEGVDLRVIHVPYANEFTNRRRVRAFVAFAWNAVKECRKVSRPDVVFATSTPLTIAIPGIFARLVHRCPMVFEVRDLWPEMPIAVGALRNPLGIALARMLEWLAYHASAAVVALSPGMADGVVGMGVAPANVIVVPNAADLDVFGDGVGSADRFFDRYPELRGTRIVSYAGTFGRLNDIEYLIRAAVSAHECDPAVRLVLCGAGQRLLDARALAAELGGLGSVVHFIPPIPKREVADLFAASRIVCSVFVPIPEMAANSANKFFDGLAAGRPVFINYGGWQADLLRRYDAGIVGDPDFPKKAGVLLAGLLADAAACRRLGANARALAEEQFGRDHLFSRLLEVLQRAVRTAGGDDSMVNEVGTAGSGRRDPAI